MTTLATFPQLIYEIDFAHDPNDPAKPAPTWTDVSARVWRGWKAKRGRQYELDRSQAGQLALMLENRDGALDPSNASSAYYPHVVPYRQMRVRAVWNSTTYPVWQGYVERWPESFVDDGLGIVSAVGVGPLAALAQIDLDAAVTDEALRIGPAAYYPLQEPASSTSFGDATGLNPAGSIVSSKYGPGVVTPGTASTLADGQVGVKFNPVGAPSGSQACSAIQTEPLIPVNAPFSLSLWGYFGASTPTGPSNESCTVVVQGDPRFDSFIWLWINPSAAVNPGKIACTVSGTNLSSPAGTAPVATSNNVVCDNKWHHITIVYLNDASSSLRIYVDGHLDMTATAAGTVAMLANQYALQVGAVAGYPSTDAGHASTMTLAHLGVWNRVLSGSEVAGLYQAGLAAFAGDSTDQRIARILSWAPWYGGQNLGAGASSVQAAEGLNGVSAAQAILDVADDENGFLYETADGKIGFQPRNARSQATTPRFTFGEQTGSGEIPYEGDITFDDDPTYIVNQAKVTRANGVTAQAQDPTSVTSYFPHASEVQTRITSDLEAIDRAAWTVATKKDPRKRISRLTFRPSHLDPSACPNAYLAALGLELGDRVRVWRRPLGRPAQSIDCFVENIEHDVYGSAGEWKVTLLLSPVAPLQAWLLAATRTTLKTTVAAAATSISLNPLADAATNPAEADLPVGARLGFYDGANAETFVATSVAGAPTPRAAGYTSITVGVARYRQANSLGAAVGIGNTAPTTTVTLASASSASTTHLWVDGELMAVTAGAGTTSLTVTRNTLTSAMPHASGATVYEYGGGLANGHTAGAAVCGVLPAGVTDPTAYDAFSKLGSTAILAY